MSIKSAVLAGAAALAIVFSAPFAMAQANLNGIYSFSFIKTCQTTISYLPTSGDITSVTASDPGTLSGTLASASFDGTGTATLTGQVAQGDLLIIGSGTAMTPSAAPTSVSYSTSVSGNSGTFTFGGITYNAFFGQVDTAVTPNVAHYMVFSGLPTGSPSNCLVHGEAYMTPTAPPLTTSKTVTPKLVGTYIFQFYESCQSTISTTGGSKALTGIAAKDPGSLTALTGIAVFGPFPTGSPTVKTGDMALTGFDDTGDLVLVNPTPPAGEFTETAVTPTPGSPPQYTFTASSKRLKLTLRKGEIGGNPKKLVYSLTADYGAISTGTTPDNIAGRVEFVGKSAGGCYVSGKATLVGAPGT